LRDDAAGAAPHGPGEPRCDELADP